MASLALIASNSILSALRNVSDAHISQEMEALHASQADDTIFSLGVFGAVWKSVIDIDTDANGGQEEALITGNALTITVDFNAMKTREFGAFSVLKKEKGGVIA